MEVVGYRWADYDTPLWASPNRVAGRWHRVGDDPTQYWCMHPAGPWAEYLRAQGISQPSDADEIASRTWAATFVLADDAVARVTFENAPDWGIDAERLVDDDYTTCQDLGRKLRRSHDALIVPSAALAGTSNLVLFGPRVISPYGAPPVDPELDIPSAPTSDRGRPPAALLDLVRHKGTAHLSLVAWRAGAPEPLPSASW